MPRPHTPRQERKIYLFCCEDSKSSRYYLEGLGRALNINIRACIADYRTPAGLDRRLKEEVRKRGKENVKKGYILFEKEYISTTPYLILLPNTGYFLAILHYILYFLAFS